MQDIETVRLVLEEMDRITRPDGQVMLMDLARLRTSNLTKDYVELVGQDYRQRGLESFYDDFKNSMFAAWTTHELVSAVPHSLSRRWYHYSPRGLPTVQFILGTPKHQRKLFLRHGLPWSATENLVGTNLRPEWQALRQTLRFAAPVSL